MSRTFETAEEAYMAVQAKVTSGWNVPVGKNAAFVCPHCHALADHHWGVVDGVSVWTNAGSRTDRTPNLREPGVIALARCVACGKEVVFLGGKVIVPASVEAPLPADDLPEAVLADYMEARTICSASPRGAAALLRLVIQKMLPILGAQKLEINAAIGELVSNGTITKALQQALDTVRVIGNEAVHPGTIDLNDDPKTAMALFRLVNFIVEKGISEPKQIDELYAALPLAKLKGIEDRDKPKR